MNASILEDMGIDFSSEKGKGILFLFFLFISSFTFEYFFSKSFRSSCRVFTYIGRKENVLRATSLI